MGDCNITFRVSGLDSTHAAVLFCLVLAYVTQHGGSVDSDFHIAAEEKDANVEENTAD